MGRFDGKVVIVTGASSGIGAATALAFAKEGAKLTITGRNIERLAETAKACKDEKAEVLEIIADLMQFENLEPLINKTVEKFGAIDILVNNAAFGMALPIENLEIKRYENMFKTNLRAPIFLCKYALPHLKKTKGSVVNVSSIAAFRANPSQVIYAMTKAALDHFTRGFAAECSAFGVRVNSVNPGVVKTPAWDNVDLNKEMVEKMMEELLHQQKLGFIKPEEIAETILFISSTTHMTGDTVVADGGVLLPSM